MWCQKDQRLRESNDMITKNLIFLVIRLKKGGAERVVSILLKKLTDNQDANIHLILLEDGIDYDLPKNISPVILHHGKKSNYRKFLELPYVAYQIAKYIKENDIDTVVSFLYRSNYINLIANFFGTKHKSIINIRSTTSRYLNEGLLGKVNLFLIRALFNKADLIISNSEGVKDDLNDLMKIKTRHISIPNPIDIAKVKELEDSKLGATKHIDENINYIISVGRLIPLKRNKDLLLAFSDVDKQLNNTKLLFLGDGDFKSTLIDYSKELGIKDKVIFLGNVDNPFYYLKRSKLFVMTSEIEGFPNVLIEAMACGIPVISSNCKSGPAEILGNDQYGLLFEVGDIDALSEKILRVMKDDELQIKLQKLSFHRVLDYDVNKIIQRFEKEILANEK